MRFRETNDPGTVLELDSQACYPVNHPTVRQYLDDGRITHPAAPGPEYDWDDNTETWVVNEERAAESARVAVLQEAQDNSPLKGITLAQANNYLNNGVGAAETLEELKAATLDAFKKLIIFIKTD